MNVEIQRCHPRRPQQLKPEKCSYARCERQHIWRVKLGNVYLCDALSEEDAVWLRASLNDKLGAFG